MRDFCHDDLRLNWSATPGRRASRSGKVDAMQVASYRVAIAPIATGIAVVFVVSQV